MGCIYAAAVADHRRFCRTPAAKSEEEANERLKKRAEADDANAIHNLGYLYHDGDMGFPQDREKAMELWLRAGELGDASAFSSIADAYYKGNGVERDFKKAKH